MFELFDICWETNWRARWYPFKKINHVTDNAKIEFDENTISEQEIISKINEGHYKVVGFENISGKEKVSKCPVCLTSGKKVPNTVFKSNLIIESKLKL